MWGVVKPLLVLLSVALNGAFVAAWLGQAVPAATRRPGDCNDGAALLRKIGVSEAQLREIEPRLTAFRTACQAQCQAINRRRRELLDLLAAAEPDRDAIRAKQKEILDGQRQVEELVVEQLLEERTLLTPPQRKALFDLIRTRCGCAGTTASPVASAPGGHAGTTASPVASGPGDGNGPLGRPRACARKTLLPGSS